MSKKINISDDLATLLAERARQGGYPSLDAAAEALITEGLIANDPGDDHSDGRDDAELRALVDAAETSGDEATWDAAAVKREVLRRYQTRQR